MDGKEFQDLVDGVMVPKDGGKGGENRLVVVNMAKWPEDFSKHRMYCCPATENGWKEGYRHYPARYIANYKYKGARYVGVVAACVHLRKSGEDRVLWKYEEMEDAEAIERARAVLAATRRNPRPCVVFLQSQLSRTELVYDIGGGLQSSRIYFDVAGLEPTDVKDLAKKLAQTPWSLLDRYRP